jgi:hypothetical protein
MTVDLGLDLEKLFEPYTIDNHTLKNSLSYLYKYGSDLGLNEDVITLAIYDIFMQIKNGKEFSMTQCHCGCGIDKAATDLIHTIQDRIRELRKEQNALVTSWIGERLNENIKQYIKENIGIKAKFKKLVGWK